MARQYNGNVFNYEKGCVEKLVLHTVNEILRLTKKKWGKLPLA